MGADLRSIVLNVEQAGVWQNRSTYPAHTRPWI